MGLHVRRTDKLISEAKKYELDEYFKWAELWFNRNTSNSSHLMANRKYFKGEKNDNLSNILDAPIKKRIFISTDEQSVIDEAKTR